MAINISSPVQIIFIRELHDILEKSKHQLDYVNCNSSELKSPCKQMLSLLFNKSIRFGINCHYKPKEISQDARNTFSIFCDSINLSKAPIIENIEEIPIKEVHSNQEGNYTGFKIESFKIGEWVCEVPSKSWAEYIKLISEILYIEHSDIFEKIVLNKIYHHKTPFFVKKEDNCINYSNEPKKYYPIFNSAIFVRYGLSANGAAHFGGVLANIFGYEKIELHTIR